MYDVIIVGARAAGSPTAMLLARSGHKVLLVDRATFPSDTVSTHMISVEGSDALHRWGLLDTVASTGCPAVRNIELDLDFPRYGHFVLKGFPAPLSTWPGAIYAPKRPVLDKILIDAARDAGAEVRENFSVQELLRDGERVIGIRGRNADGHNVQEHANLVVGADGFRSFVAQEVHAPKYYVAPPKAFGYYSYWAGVKLRGLEFYTRPGSTVIAFPTNDDHAAVFVERPERDFGWFKTDLEGNYRRAIAEVAPDLGDRIAAGTLAHRIVGAGNRPNYFRRPHGEGWALVGDAGAHKDPITAQGITDAFRDAELLVEAINLAATGTVSLADAMRSYEKRRNDKLKPLYDFIVDHAEMAPFDESFQDVLAAMRGNQADIDQFFGVIQNTVHWHDFFAAPNLARIMGVPHDPDLLTIAS